MSRFAHQPSNQLGLLVGVGVDDEEAKGEREEGEGRMRGIRRDRRGRRKRTG